MSFLRHIHACNPVVDEPFLPWMIGATRYGWVRPEFARHLLAFADLFEQDGEVIRTRFDGDALHLSRQLQVVASSLSDAGVVPPLLDEPYPVTATGRESAIACVDRVMAAYLGLRSFGQHLNGFVQREGRLLMWIGRRSRDCRIFPGALDNIVAGGLPYGIALEENLLKECEEEAGMPAELVRLAHPVGALSYNRVSKSGFRPDVLYCYDIELPADFEPHNTDGEVEEFLLLPIEQVMGIVHDSNEFKLNCNLVIIDFLIRHGLIRPEYPDYLELVTGLRTPPGMPCRM